MNAELGCQITLKVLTNEASHLPWSSACDNSFVDLLLFTHHLNSGNINGAVSSNVVSGVMLPGRSLLSKFASIVSCQGEALVSAR
jgi:hypothetical protein